jgi:hypothetical protein
MLCAVRVRASRRDQVIAELRELLFLFVLGSVGFASMVKSAPLFFGFLSVLFVASLVIARARLKNRLGAAKAVVDD